MSNLIIIEPLSINIKYINKLASLIKSHDNKQLELAFDPSYNINLINENNNYLVNLACSINNTGAVRLLVMNGSRLDVMDSNGHSILYDVIKYDFKDMLQLLLALDETSVGISIINIADTNLGYTPLFYCCEFNNPNAFNVLVSHGANINHKLTNGNTLLHQFITGPLATVNLIIMNIANINATNNTNATPLALYFQSITSQTSAHHQTLELLLEHQADINIPDTFDYTSVFHLILNANVTPSVITTCISIIMQYQPIHLNHQDTNGNSILHIIAFKKYYNLLYILLESQSNHYDYDLYNINGLTLVHLITKNNLHVDMGSIFADTILPNSDVNLQDNQGNTVLHYLAMSGAWQTYDSIIKSMNPNMNIKNITGNTVADLIGNDDDADSRTVDSDLDNSNTANTNPVNLSHSYQGTDLDAISAFKYLTKQHPTTAFFINTSRQPNIKLNLYLKQLNIAINDCTFITQFDIKWYYQQLFLPNNFNDAFQDYINQPNISSVIVPLSILAHGSIAHVNCLYYDTTTNTMERFEPMGRSSPIDYNYNADELDAQLLAYFSSLTNSDLAYIKPKDYLPMIGLQRLECNECQSTASNCEIGNCVNWVAWYLHHRITHAELQPIQIIKLIIRNIRLSQYSFSETVGNFSRDIITTTRNHYLDLANVTYDQYVTCQLKTSDLNRLLRVMVHN
ncbi:Ankyrin repeat protein [uncultured virus]|nr:Ankyrin repeat protein [uncultured virus]